MATGSHIAHALPGAQQYAFDVDQMESAARLERHLAALAEQPDSAARNTVVVCGGGFTGIEVATEMPARLRAILGDSAAIRVIVVDRSPVAGGRYSEQLRDVISQASLELGVEWRLNSLFEPSPTGRGSYQEHLVGSCYFGKWGEQRKRK